MISDLIFNTAVALLFTHELDAIRCHEWRIFAFLRPLGDRLAYQVFVLAHLPLFVWFLWMAAHPAGWFEVGVDLFLIIHVGLHAHFRRHPLYEFRGWFSHGIIVAAGVLGAVHLVILLSG